MTEQQSGEGTKIATPIATPARDIAVAAQPSSVIEHHPPGRPRVWARRLLILLLVAGGAGFLIWQAHRASPIPAWIAYGNGRLEADPIDIATKFAGRIAELRADEGDNVTAGQIVAVMDTRDLAQSLQRDEAAVAQAQRAIDEAHSNLVQAQTTTKLAEQEITRTQALLKSGYATRELLDQRQQALDAARAMQTAAEHRVSQADKALTAARHDAELVRVNIADNTLVAPKDGRIEYRLANVGEVLAGGWQGLHHARHRPMSTWTSIFRRCKPTRSRSAPTRASCSTPIPTAPIPAKVTFLADQAQFTPKMVETQSDRDKMMFRVRVRIDPAGRQAMPTMVRSGLPGVAYIKTDRQGGLAAALQGRRKA